MPPSPPPSLSFQLENEALAKARKKNRLAQRKHRQKTRSFGKASTQRGQKTSEETQKQPLEEPKSSGAEQRNLGNQNDHEDNFSTRSPTSLASTGTSHGYYTGNSLMDASHTQFLQPIDITSMYANIWASSKAKEVLMGPSIQSTGSLGSKSRTRQFPATPSFDNSFLPWARNDAILSGSSQRAEHGYNFETASQAPFDTNTPTSPGMRQVGKSTEFPSPFKAGHNGDMKEYRSASIVDVDAISPKSNHLTSPWASENIATNTDHNPRSALMTSPTQFTGASSSSSNSWANAQPFSNGDHPPAVASRPILPPGRSEAAYDQPPKADEVSCFEKVLEAIDEAGFDSIDSMIAAYYTSVFPLGSPLHSAQALSRKRHLKKLFAVLHESAKGWDAQELQNHRDGVMSCAEDILIDEMLALDLDSHKRAGKDTMIAKLESIIASKESNEVIKSNRKVFQQEAPETWGLLTELGNAMNIKSPQTASIVSAFLSLLAD